MKELFNRRPCSGSPAGAGEVPRCRPTGVGRHRQAPAKDYKFDAATWLARRLREDRLLLPREHPGRWAYPARGPSTPRGRDDPGALADGQCFTAGTAQRCLKQQDRTWTSISPPRCSSAEEGPQAVGHAVQAAVAAAAVAPSECCTGRAWHATSARRSRFTRRCSPATRTRFVATQATKDAAFRGNALVTEHRRFELVS